MHIVIKSFVPLSLFCLTIMSCRPARIPNEAVTLKEAIFGCGEYEIGMSGSHFDPYTGIGSVGEMLAFVRADTLYIKPGVRSLPVSKLALTVKSMISRPDELLIAAEEGIYRLDANLKLELLLERAVTDIALGPDNELLFIDDKASPFRVFAFNRSTQEVRPYTVAYQTNFGAVPVELIVSEEGSIWIRNEQNNLIRYSTPDSFFVYEGENALEAHLEGFTSVTLIDSPDGLLAWLKQDDQFVFLYQFVAGEWEQLYFSDLRMTAGLDALMRFAEPSNMLLLDRSLYLGSNKGMIRFRLGEPGTRVAEYDIINDPAFVWQSITHLHQKEPNLYYFINGSRQIEIDCR
ncbi:MAG: hypothetical protein AAFN10_14350 [Bacteroidota bacterium]